MRIDFEITYRGETVNLDETSSQMVVSFTLYDGNFPISGGSGAVSSVNGKTGAVVLNASDIAETSTLKWLTSTLKVYYDSAYTWVNTNGASVLQSISDLTTAIANRYTKSETDTLLSSKVDKVNGKGLSTNDLTDILKTAYDSAVTNATNAVNWITTNGTNLVNHLSNTSNPHSTTASQVGAYTTTQVDNALALKADKSATTILIDQYASNTTLTTVTTEQLLASLAIPANTYGTDNNIILKALLTKLGTNGFVTVNYRVATVSNPSQASLSGLPLIGRLVTAASSVWFIPFERYDIHVDSATSTLSTSASSVMHTDIANSGANAITNNNIDWSVQKYIIITAQLQSGSDTLTLHNFKAFK